MSATEIMDAPRPMRRALNALGDGWVIVRRDLAHYRYAPTQLVAHLAFPVIMVILFGYILGSATPVPGGNYREYLMPGLFAFGQITVAASAAVATADDSARGVMDCLRAMPIARSAVPFGRAGAEVATGILDLAALAVCGLIVGWQPHRSLAYTAAAFALLLLMRYAMSWVGVYLGLLVKNPGTADSLVPLTFPVAMLSNALVPTDGLPSWLQLIADYNPVSGLVQAVRELFGKPTVPTHVWPLQHPVIATLAWSLIILAIFVPLATRRYRTAHL